jgi:hypothetical protein
MGVHLTICDFVLVKICGEIEQSFAFLSKEQQSTQLKLLNVVLRLSGQ